MGITQRTIKADFIQDSRGNQSRKRLSTKPATIGDWLQVKRIEASLSQAEVAHKVGVVKRKVQAWEYDKLMPTDTEWLALSAILPLNTGIPKPNPTVD